MSKELRFLADMGISLRTVSWLREQNYDSIHLRELNLQRLTDDLIIEKAEHEGRVVLTFDLDFGALMAASKGKLPSVIIFRLDNQKAFNQIQKLKEVIDQSSLALLHGAIISIDEFEYRIRYLPIKK